MANWYCGSTKYSAIAQWAALTVYGAGSIVRQLAAPAVGSERCFRTAAGGTSGDAEPTWVLTKGAAQPADGTITDWIEVTGNETYGWTAAHARLNAALAWCAAGDKLYVSNNHNETNAPDTISSPGTAALPVTILCVVDTAAPPTTLATTAAVTGASLFTFYGFAYCYGISISSTFAGGVVIKFTTINPWWWRMEKCNLGLGTNVTNTMLVGCNSNAGIDDQLLELINSTVTFGNAAQRIRLYCATMKWQNKLDSDAILGTSPTTLFETSVNQFTIVECNGLDLTGVVTNLVGIAVSTQGKITFKNCSLPVGVTVITGTIPGQGGVEVLLDNCDSGDTNYRFAHYKYQGSIIQATNCYLNAAFSMKMTPITGAAYISPLESPPIAQWNSVVGSAKTATIEIIHNEAAALNDDEIWMELEYLGTSGFPLASFVDDKMAWFGTPAAQTTSTASWTEDLAGEIKQKLSVSFTPQEAGYIVAKVHLGKVTTNPVYVDPYITLS